MPVRRQTATTASLSTDGAPAEPAPLSRRSLLRTALGATAGAAAATLTAAAPAAAITGDPVLAGNTTLAGASTEIRYDGVGGFTGMVLLANDSTYAAADSIYPAAVGGWAGAGSTAGAGGIKNGVYGYTDAGDGNGVIGGVFAIDTAITGGAGVSGIGFSAGTTGVLATSEKGTALRVEGVARFSRSGRVSVPKGHSYVDISVTGGLGTSANILATIQMYRPGVWVTGVRRNYPSTGKARIYLNKVASTTSVTPVAWFVVG